VKRHLTTLLLILIFLIGLALVLYPTVSNWWNSFHASKAISDYAEQVASLDDDAYDALWAEALAYNQSLKLREGVFVSTPEQKERYPQVLNPGGNGVMGYIEIPSLDVSLPIYHGTDEAILQVAVGHLEWSSLPVGGEGTHSVLSGHRGLPSARLFTDLDDLRVGDLFIIRVLGEIMSYEVDKILIVEPHEMDGLRVEPGMDLCTLVTCTPYGVNTHRLLVRGHRVENTPEAKAARVTANAIAVDSLITAAVVAVPMVIIAVTVLLLTGSGGKKSKKRKKPDTKITRDRDIYS
jgi:sortase A